MNDPNIIDIGSRRELFIDRLLIDDGVAGTRDIQLRMHTPQPAGVALAMDKPWEGPFSFYTTVLRHDDGYMMTYRGWPQVDPCEQGAACTCIATSPDGVHWTRPELGLVTVGGSARNNIILHEAEHGGVCHNFCPFFDARPGVSEEERFKALGGTWRETGGLIPYASADGIHWRRLSEAPVVTHPTFAFDSQNVAFWSEAEGCYVCYYRTFVTLNEQRIRWVSRQTSPDFLHWANTTEMQPEGGPVEHLYTQQTHPYYRAPHIYIAMAARFMPGRQAITVEQAEQVGVDERYYHDCSDGVLLTTRAGTTTYQRTFLESMVRPGLGPEHWTSRSNYPAYGLVSTASGLTPETSFYVNRRYAQPAAFVERMTLRPDGFASVHAGYHGGELITKPLRFAGNALEINYATSAAGSIRVELQDADGAALEAFALADAVEIVGDELARVVHWKQGSDLSRLADRPVRLRIVLRDADLYALRFFAA
jgi:hypothetical protein